jgi:hypothetical protein
MPSSPARRAGLAIQPPQPLRNDDGVPALSPPQLRSVPAGPLGLRNRLRFFPSSVGFLR